MVLTYTTVCVSGSSVLVVKAEKKDLSLHHPVRNGH